MPRRSRDRLRRLALLTPSCADREEKRVTHGNGLSREEQLDPRNPNQRSLLAASAEVKSERLKMYRPLR